jgi:hypothetical protein
LEQVLPSKAERLRISGINGSEFPEPTVEKGLSKAGLMLFMQLDQGAVLQKETGQDTPRIIRFLIGKAQSDVMRLLRASVATAG